MPDISYRHEGMDRKVVPQFQIVYKDVYSWKYLYTLLHEWLNDHGYAAADEDFEEIFYEYLEQPDGAEIWVKWRLSKSEVFSFEGLYRYDVDVDFHILGQKEVEVVSGGKKHKANRGEVEITVNAAVVRDPDDKVRKHWLGKNFYKFIFDVFLKKKGKAHDDQLFNDMARLQDAIRTYLKLETYLPERELGEYFKTREPS